MSDGHGIRRLAMAVRNPEVMFEVELFESMGYEFSELVIVRNTSKPGWWQVWPMSMYTAREGDDAA